MQTPAHSNLNIILFVRTIASHLYALAITAPAPVGSFTAVIYTLKMVHHYANADKLFASIDILY